MKNGTAIIIGAGPAGLTAAYELLTRTAIKPLVLERSGQMGGLSQTVNYKGNRLDMGGHRFFSKSDRVMQWWLERFPLEKTSEQELRLAYQGASRSIATGPATADPKLTDRVMLVRHRKSRIYYLRRFFDYPIQLTPDTLRKLGLWRSSRIGLSYLKSALSFEKPPATLEQFFIRRFGRELYQTFFKEYTEKVWGVPCSEISAEWGEQRVKGLSIRKAILHFAKQAFQSSNGGVSQKKTEVSLIEQFLYPKYGPGQMWEAVACDVQSMGGSVVTGMEVCGMEHSGNRITAVIAADRNGQQHRFAGDYFFSTMAIKDLVRAMGEGVPANVREVSEGLLYRDFITVGLLVKKLRVHEGSSPTLISDNWIYLQEPDILAGRLQIFNNWSPYMVGSSGHIWLGVEYFCNEGDDLWRKSDAEMVELAKQELDRIEIVAQEDVVDATVVRIIKAYPAYFGTYARFGEMRSYFDGFENLFLVGRNGMHKYNNQDHSMLTAMTAVDNIAAGKTDKTALWQVNTEMEYHESK